MIDPNWSVVDLDPRTWRNLGRFIEPGQYISAAQPGEHGLFVLHDGARVLRAADSQTGLRRDLDLSLADGPAELARRLYARGEWQRVHVIDRRHLAQVARMAQATPRRELTLDQYYHLVYNLLWGDAEGYVSVPPHPGHWHGWTYAGIKSFVDHLPDAATVALGVLDGGIPTPARPLDTLGNRGVEGEGGATTAIGLILDLRGGLIRTVTTFETFGLPAPAFDLTQESFDRLWALLEGRVSSGAAAPAAALLCSQAVFDDWITGADKLGILQQAAGHGAAFWRVLQR
jgi:hypothetical protein